MSVDTSMDMSPIGQLAEILNVEVSETDRTVQAQTDRVGIVSECLNTSAAEMVSRVSMIETEAVKVSEDLSQVSTASEQIASSARMVEDLLHQTKDDAVRATSDSKVAYEVIDGLVTSAEQIADVVEIVQGISSKTRLLALNANIEAERAGEAGQGFAVVAAEVKELAQQTEEAMLAITTQTEAIRNSTSNASVAITQVSASVEAISQATSHVAAQASQQTQATAEINSLVQRAKVSGESVTTNAFDLQQRSEGVQDISNRLKDVGSFLQNGLQDMRTRFDTLLHSSLLDEFKQSNRQEMFIPISVQLESGEVFEGYSMSLSVSGGLLSLPMPGTPLTQNAVISLNGDVKVPAQVQAVTSLGAHITFAPNTLSEEELSRIHIDVAELEKPFIAIAQEGARRLSAALEKAVKEGFPEGDLFNKDYRLIEGTNPIQYTSRFDSLTDKLFPEIQDDLLGRDDRLVIAVAEDRNGYIPTHNAKYAHPQKPDDPIWNAANSRTKRFFDDRAGLKAAWNTEPFIVHCYKRDMGGGQFVYLKEFDAPITVNGQHWGGFRVAAKV